MAALELESIITISQTLTSLLEKCFGPHAMSCLVCKAMGTVLITNTGDVLLQALHMSHPVGQLIISAVHRHYLVTGDNSKTMLLWLNGALSQV